MNLRRLSVAGFVLAVLAMAMLIARNAVFSRNALVIAVQAFAALLMIWARLTFGRRSFHAAADPTGGGLVTRGPYRYLRHPIYAALIYFTWAGVLAHVSPAHVLLAVLVTAGLAVRMLAEERLVTARYPEYAEYARRTARVAPYLF